LQGGHDLVVMGVDPGFASTGVVVLRQGAGGVDCIFSGVVATKKAEKKSRGGLRVTNDDLRRYTEIFERMDNIFDRYNPTALGVEAYMPGFRGKNDQGFRGGGAATKTLGVYGGLIFWGLARGMYVSPSLPLDLKRRFCGKQSASKIEVEKAMCILVQDLREQLDRILKTKREHVADAAGHAYLVLEEIAKVKLMVGLT